MMLCRQGDLQVWVGSGISDSAGEQYRAFAACHDGLFQCPARATVVSCT